MFYKIFLTFIFTIVSHNIFASEIFKNFDEWNNWFNANKTTLRGEMSCKITDQIIIEVKEGKPKRYTNFRNEPKVGDKLSLIYQSIGESVKFQLTHPSEEYFNTAIGAEKADINTQVASFYHGDDFLKYTLGRLTVRKDSLSFQKYNIAGGYSLELDRYYKNDWGGIFTAIYAGEPHVITLDCRNIKDKIDEIIERYKTYPGKLETKKKY